MKRYEVHHKENEYIVINKSLNTHAHLPNLNGVNTVFKLIRKKVPLNQIKKEYLRVAVARLEPKRFKKDKYRNTPKKVRRG